MTAAVEPTDRQLTRVAVRDPELFNQIRQRLARVLRCYEEAFAEPVPGSTVQHTLRIQERARELSHALATTGLPTSPYDPVRVSRAVLSALVAPAEAADAAFWETTLGRVLALRGGYPRPAMPRSHACALLDVSRQRISQMVKLGLLVEVKGEHIATASLTRLLVAA